MKNLFYTVAANAFRSTKLALAAALILTATSGIAFAQSAAKSSGGSGGGVPELDPSSMMGAVALLSGGFVMLTDKIRRK